MVVQGRHLQQAPTFAEAAFGVLEVAHLQHHGQGLNHEYAAHHGQHNFLAHDDRHRSQRCAQRQRTHVAHKHLCRMGVEPQKGQTGPGNGRAKNQQFARAGDVGEKQVLGVHGAAGHIGKNPQRRTHHHHRHDGQTVQPVGQIHRVARSHNHQVGQDHKAQHAQRVADFFEEGQQQAGLGRQADIKAGADPHAEQLPDALVGVFRYAEHQGDGGCDADGRLPKVFFTRAHAFGVFAHHLAPIVDPADGAKPQRHDQHNPDKAVAQVGPEQG